MGWVTKILFDHRHRSLTQSIRYNNAKATTTSRKCARRVPLVSLFFFNYIQLGTHLKNEGFSAFPKFPDYFRTK